MSASDEVAISFNFVQANEFRKPPNKAKREVEVELYWTVTTWQSRTSEWLFVV